MAVNFAKYIESTGTHYISNSGHDENNRYNSGSAGDQTGKEWELKGWYNRPWTVVLRYPDQAVGIKIAELGIAAALNNKVGYDQYQRTSYWTQLQKAGYDPSKITTACEADCTAGVTANVKAVGCLLGITKLKNLATDTYSGNMKSRFVSAGFTALTAKKYTGGSTYLLPGDILLYEGHHAATNITLGKNAGKIDYKPAEPDAADPVPSDLDYSYVDVTRGNYYVRTGPATTFAPINVAHTGDKLEYLGETVDGWYKVKFADEACWISSKCGDVIVVEKKSNVMTVKSGSWNVRKGPSTSYSKIGVVRAGDKLEYLDDTKNNWYKISFGDISGWVSGKAF